ncbi:DUF1569 domain-containing protein [Paenibacillus sp. FSL R7-0297]|uniref:DUF1569 domain-containing protein n=1 Tax=unclassified Paenibacillus TaxID=185978 RepID=UPI0004F91247|nr:DUF1569 domain-containing protein [Paenibacillus sp. FSL R5-0912]AIQ42126.1 hypothetical protein R50912_20275 [Paenibacillus sp. FSL R5-0912]
MNNIFDLSHSKEILVRIDQLMQSTQPQWGRMDVAQMLAHCSSFQDIAMGKSHSPRSWLGMLIGKFAKPIFYNDKPLPRNMSTIQTIMIVDKREFEVEKEKLKQNILILQSDGPKNCNNRPHPFFGVLTSEEWGKGIYKHLDHHLKQFGV